jgi:hypothetical protein
MSLKVSKNLVIGGAIVVALLVGTVLLGNYANILPADSGSQAKTCLAAGSTSRCAGEAAPGCCPKVCPPDCTKPCCAGEAAPGCCPMAGMSAATNSGCCPKTNTATE